MEQGLAITRTKISDRWKQLTQQTRQGSDRSRTTIITYTVWNVWKERYKHIFDNKARSTEELLEVIRNDLRLLLMAEQDSEAKSDQHEFHPFFSFPVLLVKLHFVNSKLLLPTEMKRQNTYYIMLKKRNEILT